MANFYTESYTTSTGASNITFTCNSIYPPSTTISLKYNGSTLATATSAALNTNPTTIPMISGATSPRMYFGVIVDPVNGDIYAQDQNTRDLCRFNASGTLIATTSLTGVLFFGYVDIIGDKGYICGNGIKVVVNLATTRGTSGISLTTFASSNYTMGVTLNHSRTTFYYTASQGNVYLAYSQPFSNFLSDTNFTQFADLSFARTGLYGGTGIYKDDGGSLGSITCDLSDNVYITTWGNAQVFKYNPSGVIQNNGAPIVVMNTLRVPNSSSFSAYYIKSANRFVSYASTRHSYVTGANGSPFLDMSANALYSSPFWGATYNELNGVLYMIPNATTTSNVSTAPRTLVIPLWENLTFTVPKTTFSNPGIYVLKQYDGATPFGPDIIYNVGSPTITIAATSQKNAILIDISSSPFNYPQQTTYYYSVDGGATYIDTKSLSITNFTISNLNEGSYSVNVKAISMANGSIVWSSLVSNTVSINVTCFLEGTKIMRLNPVSQEAEYICVENLRRGDLIKTSAHGFQPIHSIGYSTLFNPGATRSDQKTPDQIYRYKRAKCTELFEDLYITGNHCVLRNTLSPQLQEKVVEHMGKIHITESKYRLPAYLDTRAEPWEHKGKVRIWHFALNHDDATKNYGVYANGMLVESTSIRYLNEISRMTLVE